MNRRSLFKKLLGVFATVMAVPSLLRASESELMRGWDFGNCGTSFTRVKPFCDPRFVLVHARHSPNATILVVVPWQQEQFWDDLQTKAMPTPIERSQVFVKATTKQHFFRVSNAKGGGTTKLVLFEARHGDDFEKRVFGRKDDLICCSSKDVPDLRKRIGEKYFGNDSYDRYVLGGWKAL